MKHQGHAEATVDLVGTLEAVLIRGDGSHRDLGQLSGPQNYRLIGRPIQWWRAFWRTLKGERIIDASIGFAAFLATYAVVDQPHLMRSLFNDPRVQQIILPVFGLVVQNGANFLATDMASGQASPRISAMNFHDSGTGTIAATSTDSGLGTQAGPTTRATGVQSNPATNQYRSVGTITYATGPHSITEWGLFNQAAQGGTMWDRRVFSVITVQNGDSLQTTYTLTLSGGGT